MPYQEFCRLRYGDCGGVGCEAFHAGTIHTCDVVLVVRAGLHCVVCVRGLVVD